MRIGTIVGARIQTINLKRFLLYHRFSSNEFILIAHLWTTSSEHHSIGITSEVTGYLWSTVGTGKAYRLFGNIYTLSVLHLEKYNDNSCCLLYLIVAPLKQESYSSIFKIEISSMTGCLDEMYVDETRNGKSMNENNVLLHI